MGAYSYLNFPGDLSGTTPVLTIGSGHPLANPHRAPYWSGATAARALLTHMMRELSGPEGARTYNALRQAYQATTATARDIQTRLERQRSRATAALEAAAYEPSDAELILGMRMAELQRDIGRHILNRLTREGRPPEQTIDDIQRLNETLMSLMIESDSDTGPDANRRSDLRRTRARELLLATMGASDQEATALADDYLHLARELASVIPNSITREEPAVDLEELLSGEDRLTYERLVADMLARTSAEATQSQLQHAATRLAALNERLATPNQTLARVADDLARPLNSPDPASAARAALDAATERLTTAQTRSRREDTQNTLNAALAILTQTRQAIADPREPADLDAGMSLEDSIRNQALQAVLAGRTQEDLALLGTTRDLIARERTDIALQILASFPPTVQLPDSIRTHENFHVRMATEEEAQVMHRLIRWAGETGPYPGPEAAARTLASWIQQPVTTRTPDQPTMLLVVDDEPRLIAEAQRITALFDPDTRLIIQAPASSIARRCLGDRAGPVVEGPVPIDRSTGTPILRTEARTILLGHDDLPTDALIANATHVGVLHQLPTVSLDRLEDTAIALAQARDEARRADHRLEQAERAAEDAYDPQILLRLRQIERTTPEQISDEAIARFRATAEGAAALAQLETHMPDAEARDRASRQLVLQFLSDGYRRALTETLPPAVAQELARAREAARAAAQALAAAERRHQLTQTAHDRIAGMTLSTGQTMTAWAILMAHDAGKLSAALSATTGTPGDPLDPGAPKSLIQQSYWSAVLSASRILQYRGALRDQLYTLSRPRGGVTSIVMDGSNVLFDRRGLEEARRRLEALPAHITILAANNPRNPITRLLCEHAGTRRVLRATAWRVESRTPASEQPFRERATELHLGFEPDPTQGTASRPIQWTPRDIRGAIILVSGAGTIARDTLDAINARAARQGLTGPLTPEVADRLAGELRSLGAHLQPPMIASAAGQRAIAQEALIDAATACDITANIGPDYRDYHSAQLIRMAADAGKLVSVTDSRGQTLPLETAITAARPFAPTIAETTLSRLERDLATHPESRAGRLILASLGVHSHADTLGQHYPNLTQVAADALAGRPIAGLPQYLADRLRQPMNWKQAADRTREMHATAADAGFTPVAPGDRLYPPGLSGSAGILYMSRPDIPLGEGATTRTEPWFTRPVTAVIATGASPPAASDLAAFDVIARQLKAAGHDLAIAVQDRFSAGLLAHVAAMPKDARPRLVAILDSHPELVRLPDLRAAIDQARAAGANLLTPTLSTTRDPDDPRPTLRRDPDAARRLPIGIADRAVVLKLGHQDPGFAAVAEAMRHKVPIAIYLPQLRPEMPAAASLLADSDRAGTLALTRPGFMDYPVERTGPSFEPISNPQITTGEIRTTRGFRDSDYLPNDRLDALPEGRTVTRLESRLSWQEGLPVLRHAEDLERHLRDPDAMRRIATQRQTDTRARSAPEPQSRLAEEIAELFRSLETPDVEGLSTDLSVLTQTQFVRRRSGLER